MSDKNKLESIIAKVAKEDAEWKPLPLPSKNCMYLDTMDDGRIICDATGDDVSREFCFYCRYYAKTYKVKPCEFTEVLFQFLLSADLLKSKRALEAMSDKITNLKELKETVKELEKGLTDWVANVKLDKVLQLIEELEALLQERIKRLNSDCENFEKRGNQNGDYFKTDSIAELRRVLGDK